MKQLVVAPNGSDSAGTGSEAAPFATLALAFDRAEPGDTILLRAGKYRGTVTTDKPGQANAPIRVTAWPGERAILTGGVTVAALVIAHPYWEFENFTIEPTAGPSGKPAWVKVQPEAKGVVLRNLTLARNGDISKAKTWNDFGILIEADEVTVEKCRIYGMTKGIHVKGSCTGVTITGCHIGPTFQSNIVVGTSFSTVRGLLISYNVLERSLIEDGIQFMQNFDAEVKEADVSNLGTIVYANTIRDHGENAIDLKGAGDVVIDSNVIYRIAGSNNGPLHGWNRGSFSTITRGKNSASGRLIIRNNTIYNSAPAIRLLSQSKIYNNVLWWNNYDYTGSDSKSAGAVFSGVRQNEAVVRDVAIKNNVIGGQRHGTMALYVDSACDMDVDYNVYASERWIDKRTKAVTSFAAWQQALTQAGFEGCDQHSKVDNALAFVEVPTKPNGDHHTYNFQLRTPTPGGPLTTARTSGNGKIIAVKDASYFTNWFGRQDLPDEVIWVGQQAAKVEAVNHEKHQLHLDRALTWQEGDPIRWGSASPCVGLMARVDTLLPPLPPVEPPVLPPEPPVTPPEPPVTPPEPPTPVELERVRLVLEVHASKELAELLRQAGTVLLSVE
jgi:hypothetical protein